MEKLNLESKEYKGEELTENKSLITFSKLNKYFIIPFLCAMFCTLSNYFLVSILRTSVIKKPEFIISMFIDLSYFFGGLFHFISYFRYLDNTSDKSSNKKRKLIQEKSVHKNENVKKYFVLLLSLLLVIQDLFKALTLSHSIFETRLYFILFIPFISKFILKDSMYKHHYCSLSIAIIGIIVLIIPICLKLVIDDILANIYNAIVGLSYSLFLVIFKYMIEKYYVAPLKTILIFGIIVFITNCVGYSIYSLIKYHDFSYFKDCLDFTQVENKVTISIYFLLTIIFLTILQALSFLSIFYFSPTLIMVTDMISPFLLWLILIIQDGGKLPDDILYPIAYIIILFASLIYNEILIFNFCNLNQNTKKFVSQRENIELGEIRKDDISLTDLDNDKVIANDKDDNYDIIVK